jgi:crotonobetainyl-CoA:carnitine CoA-transferase CaiB-like acyl-CoA transferase
MWAALAILAALRERDRTGAGCELTTALFDTAVAWIPYQLLGYLGTGEVPGPQGSGTAMIAPYQAFPAADGHVMIAAGSDALFLRLCAALDAPALAADPRFADNPARVAHRAALVEALSARTRDRKTDDLVAALRRAGVPAAPILTLDRVAAAPQTVESELLLPGPHPRLADYRSVALPLRWNGRRPTVRRPPPRLGEDSDDVLTWLGYTLDDARGLRARGVVA